MPAVQESVESETEVQAQREGEVRYERRIREDWRRRVECLSLQRHVTTKELYEAMYGRPTAYPSIALAVARSHFVITMLGKHGGPKAKLFKIEGRKK